jgi:hypothetical protein
MKRGQRLVQAIFLYTSRQPKKQAESQLRSVKCVTAPKISWASQFKYVTIPNSEGDIIGKAEEYVTTAAWTAHVSNQDAVVRGTVSLTGRQIKIKN